MQYKAVRESDGTYSIRQSKHGMNWEIIYVGVRGCNVNRVINKLYKSDYFKEK